MTIYLAIAFVCAAVAQPGPVTPYAPDAQTVLLDHLDASTGATVLGFINDGQPCGPARPPATPNFTYGSGPTGLSQALTLFPPTGMPAGSGTCLKYPGELLTQTNGTLECWVYLTNHAFSIHQFNYVGECQGNVGGLDVNEFGQLQATIWHTTGSSFTFNSGAAIVALNTWTHVALTWGSTGAKLYINGAMVGSHPNTGSFASWFGLDSVFVFTGVGNYVDELRISSTQRTSFNLPSTGMPFTVELKMFAGLLITGSLGSNIGIQATPSLGPTNWTTLTNLALPASPYVFIDYRSPTNTQQFYRVVPN